MFGTQLMVPWDLGVVWMLASARALCLPTNSVQVFQVEPNSDFGIESKVSLHQGECRVVVKLVVWHLGVSIQD